jgi:hypothetical protein
MQLERIFEENVRLMVSDCERQNPLDAPLDAHESTEGTPVAARRARGAQCSADYMLRRALHRATHWPALYLQKMVDTLWYFKVFPIITNDIRTSRNG